MAVNPSDTRYAISKETVAGTTNATPAFLVLDYMDGTEVVYESDWLESPTRRANRASSGGRPVAFKVTGSLKQHFARDAATDLLLESGLSGTFNTNVLSSGANDTSFTIEKRMSNSEDTQLYSYFTGCQVTKLTISGTANGNIEFSADIIGMARTTGTAQKTGATYANPSNAMKLAGVDVVPSIAGLTVDFLKFEYTVEHTREALNKLGSASARGIATSGFRKVNGSVDFFREDWTPETVLLSASGAALTLPIGSGVNGYSINIPVAQFRIPKDGEEGAAATVSAEFMAKETAGATTITKLA